jgi:hypothetical protein
LVLNLAVSVSDEICDGSRVELLLSQHVKTFCGSSADLRVMFGSLIISTVGSLILIRVLRGCGAF